MPDLLEVLGDMLYGGRYVLSEEVSNFERAFAAFCEAKYARGVNSGTDALVIAMRSLGICSGDEVITVANTFHATVAAIVLVGARPVLVDADPDTFLMDTEQLASVINAKTRAVLPVHLYGKPVPMEPILKLAKQADLLVIEDAAQAHGAKIAGRTVGSFGIAGCFSFHPSKNLAAAGDAGMIVTSDSTLADQLGLQRALGQAGQNDHVTVGMNSKLDAIQACILGRKLPSLRAWNENRARVAQLYRDGLAQLPVSFQATSADEVHVYHLFQIRVEGCRDELLSFLNTKGIDAVIRYPVPIHLQPAFSNYGWRVGQFPVSESLANDLLCLPVRPDMTLGEIDYVVAQVRAFYDTRYSLVSSSSAFAIQSREEVFPL